MSYFHSFSGKDPCWLRCSRLMFTRMTQSAQASSCEVFVEDNKHADCKSKELGWDLYLFFVDLQKAWSWFVVLRVMEEHRLHPCVVTTWETSTSLLLGGWLLCYVVSVDCSYNGIMHCVKMKRSFNWNPTRATATRKTFMIWIIIMASWTEISDTIKYPGYLWIPGFSNICI